MNLAVVNEAVTGMNGVEHEFTEEEKNFVVQFAFRSGSKEDTISLIEALAHSTDKVQSEEIMVTYRSKYDIKPVSYTHLDVYKRQGWNDPLDPYDGLGAGDAGFIPGCGDPLYDPVKRFCVLGCLSYNWDKLEETQ